MKEIFIIVSMVVTVIAVINIASVYHWMQSETLKRLELSKYFSIPAPIIDREVWRAQDYKSDIIIMDVTDKSKQDWFMNYYHGIPSEGIIIRDNAQLDYVIQKQAHALTKQMIRDGCIKIINEPDIYSGHPLRRLIQLHFKIYKPV